MLNSLTSRYIVSYRISYSIVIVTVVESLFCSVITSYSSHVFVVVSGTCAETVRPSSR